MYQLCIKHDPTDVDRCVRRLADDAVIPFDPANTDYQEFLRWCDEGNEPLPADEPAEQ